MCMAVLITAIPASLEIAALNMFVQPFSVPDSIEDWLQITIIY